jgi:anaerobic selenocysteine-containing dehydrogenase
MGLYEEGPDPHGSDPNILLGPPHEQGASSARPTLERTGPVSPEQWGACLGSPDGWRWSSDPPNPARGIPAKANVPGQAKGSDEGSLDGPRLSPPNPIGVCWYHGAIPRHEKQSAPRLPLATLRRA